MDVKEFLIWWASHPDTPTGAVSVQVTPTAYLAVLGVLLLGALYFAREGMTKKNQPAVLDAAERGSAWLIAVLCVLGLIVILAGR